MKIKIIFIFLIVASLISMVSAWTFNGTVRDVNGNLLNSTLVNITFWTMGGPTGMSLVGSNSTTSNASGWFNLSVFENSSYMYQPIIRYTNATTNALDYIGQSLPQFPYAEFANTSNINFYLRPAGTINITAINSTGNRITFRYQVKDTKLGYPIAGEFNNPISEAIVYVPRDRNYSVMIYPNQAMPVSFNWNNFTASSSYTIATGLSTYNVTTHTVQKTFNSTDNLIRLSGYIQNLTGNDFADWNEFTVVPYLLEPGNMIYLGDNAGMPYNMSAWSGQSDKYNLTTGFYNITLPGPAESATYILFATARNGTNYYGGYKNITLNYSSSATESNFTMYRLMATNWGSSNGNITLNDAVAWSKVNISSAKQQFNLVNSSNNTLSNVNAHLEIKVDYTNYNATEFTFMTDISSGSGSFYLPLLNASVKEINIFSQSYSPKRVPTKTAAQILNNSNITMSTFNPGDIDGADLSANVYINLYQSNSTCDVPSPPAGCSLADSANMDSFNPLSSIIGGGALSFRMGLTSSKIEVHYVNVDMLASGPPDALFDDSATTSTSGSFDSAMRFGSNGPTIYDYVLISMPYTEGSTSTTGLNEAADVNISIPLLYDENWNIIWNTTANGTNGSALAGNQSHYNTYSSQWQTLMGQNNCTKNQSKLNSTTPCYIDTTNNRIWIRLPHFSGTKPSITGGLITASSTGTTGGSSGSATATTYTVTPSLLAQGYTRSLAEDGKLKMNISNEWHYLNITKITESKVTIAVYSTPQTVELTVNQTKKFEITGDDYYDLSVKLNSITSNATRASITVQSIHEQITGGTTNTTTSSGDNAQVGETVGDSGEGITGEAETSLAWLWILIIVVAVIIVGSGIWYFKNKNK